MISLFRIDIIVKQILKDKSSSGKKLFPKSNMAVCHVFMVVFSSKLPCLKSNMAVCYVRTRIDIYIVNINKGR
jgi:hypothetical protein